MGVRQSFKEMKNYIKDHKYTIGNAIPALVLDADAAFVFYNYAVTGNPKALAAGMLIGATALFADWTVYEEYKHDLKSINLRKDIENSEKIIQTLGL
jgi:hypothetical protein